MPSFEELFAKSGGRPIVYRGKTLMLDDDFPMEGASMARLVFESSDSPSRQGVALTSKRKIKIAKRTIGTDIVLWQDTAPQIVQFEVASGTSTIAVHNVWDFGNGVTQAWHNGAAMIAEPIANGRRYRCNDGEPDDDFDDIVFRLERITAE